ncbi:hypothetical protein GUJ93_ZPchr0001g29822 [Zizania palustris]|uniref:Peptidase A1 domain-containing protein n=1 Tax=Zizania palustris TaxID=103762 RepID=A0A8J5R9N7_ZIZPA|nr:hypothetical protein GUJ93_ZPchr0001g29822 [Zizania palustris]
MAGRKLALAIAFFFLVLVMPQMVTPAKSSAKSPRFTMNPRTKKQTRDFLKNHGSSDTADLLPGKQEGEGGSDGQSKSGGGGDREMQAPATNAGVYIFSYDIGTPPQRVSGALDIASDLVWTQCAPCATCDTTQPFYPLNSTTAAAVECTNLACQQFVPQTCSAADDSSQCSYTYMYGGGGGAANTTGFLATDSFTFDTIRVDGVVFGCGLDNVGDFGDASGVIGLGRGNLSLVSQLQVDRFSYHFAPDDSVDAQSFILFGEDAAPQTSRTFSTRLLASDANPNLYYVDLAGIKVDGKDLDIPRGTFDIGKDGSGGVALTITTLVTLLDEVAYKLLRQAMVSGIGLSTVDGSALGLDLCYTSQSMAKAKVPSMALVFSGGAVMELEMGNYFYMDETTGLECLTIVPSPAGDGSLLGGLIQTGTHMIYDISGSKLVFESLEQAAAAAPPPLGSSKSSDKTVGRRSWSAPPPLISPAVLLIQFACVVLYMFK